jgi:hypothetical protein
VIAIEPEERAATGLISRQGNIREDRFRMSTGRPVGKTFLEAPPRYRNCRSSCK